MKKVIKKLALLDAQSVQFEVVSKREQKYFIGGQDGGRIYCSIYRYDGRWETELECNLSSLHACEEGCYFMAGGTSFYYCVCYES